MNITCLDCLQTFRTERLKWYNARCPCGAKVRYAFAAHGDVTIAGIFKALMRYHFGDDAGPMGRLKDRNKVFKPSARKS